MQLFDSCLENQRKMVELFEPLPPQKKYEQLIELGKQLLPYPASEKVPEKLVAGCQSRLYLHTEYQDGLILFFAESDALISAGLAALLLSVYSGEPPEALLKCPPTFLEQLQLQASLSPSRSNGLSSLHLRMQQEALKKLAQKTRIVI